MKEKQLQLVTFEQAKKLKEFGFNWECEDFYTFGSLDNCRNLINYNNNEALIWNEDEYKEGETDDKYYSAPTIALALKWFRDEKNAHRVIGESSTYFENEWYYNVSGNEYDSYEAAESSLLDELIKFLENKL